jgi:hypothetical protein
VGEVVVVEEVDTKGEEGIEVGQGKMRDKKRQIKKINCQQISH